MQKKQNLVVNLTFIYLCLLGLCLALYAIMQIYVQEIDRGTATNLMIWSATLFPSIALIYTFHFWREQKGSEVLSRLSEESFFKLTNAAKIHEQIDEDYRETLLKKILDNIEMVETDLSKELLKQLDIEMHRILENCHLIYKYSKDEHLKIAFNDMFYKYELYKSTRLNAYRGMKVLEHTDTKLHAISFDKNDKNEYMKHSEVLNAHSSTLRKHMNNFSDELLKFIFYSSK
ncbi:hypothetical protein [Acinetobacter pittii]|uniref:hypothetical protein n=1 Tax=Acinetobacter pittii TaxID=48296 RepID=UPI0010237F2D|nr:hypothetical protein [Acinetobacter pittii]RZG80014.1 hypothetical protein EXE06_17370 [Acinetobacter pittii]RZH51465.1 hypothetical protein EXD88_17645 [Acinetobacter pittii]RZH54864.1 hypothetical protein EXD90_17575 [Acinetobacter pittii]